MKPLTLKLSGLQSYREEQVIDFESLCESGLFGIFGPTGSGKSTILDAITLALYGKVERATNGTQGIMNQAENQLMVSFAFQLSSAEETKTFRVERRFKRANEISISNSVSRFVEITLEGDVVLADKLADVTRLVEEHIGLKMDDFTRAVVLPQGKFAEFLSLKGSERRQMLQRLFSLERYGDVLAGKLSRSLKETESEIRTSLAEQQGLGDASASALEAAEAVLTEASQAAETAKTERQQTEERYQAWNELRKMQVERDQLEERRKRGAQQSERMQQQQRRLQRALEAEQVMPSIHEMARAQSEHNRSIEVLRDADVLAKTDQRARQAAEQAWNESKSQREQQEPELHQRIDQLKQAVQVNQELEQLTVELAEHEAKGQTSTDKAAQAQGEMTRVSQLLQRAAVRQGELKQRMRELDCSSALRERMQEARLAKTTLTEAERRRDELGSQMEQVNKQLERSNAVLREQMEHMVAWSERLPLWLTSVGEVQRELMAAKQSAQQCTVQVRIELEQARIDVRNASKAALAAELAETLQAGESCPVCGSKEHAVLTHNYSEQQQAYVEAEKQADNYERWLEELRTTTVSVESALERCYSLRTDLRDRLADANKRAASWLPSFGAQAEGAAAIQAKLMFEGMAVNEQSEPLLANEVPHVSDIQSEQANSTRLDEISDMKKCVNQAVSQMDQLTQEKESILRSLDELLWNLQQAVSNLNNSQQTYQEITVQYTSADQVLKEKRQSWEELYPEWEAQSLEVHWQTRQEADRELEDSRQRYEKSVAYIEEMEEQLKQQQVLHREAELVVVQSETAKQGLLRIKAEYDARLAPWLAFGPIPTQLHSSEQQLFAIRQREEQTQQLAETARRFEAEAMQQLALSQQATNSAKVRLRDTQQQLHQKLEQSGFANQDEVVGCRLEETERQQLAEEYTAYEEEQRTIQIRMNRIVEQLQGREIGDEEWSTCVQQWQSAAERDEAAFAFRVKAERDVEQLRAKHARWMVLEEQMSGGRERHSRLQQLQSVFRGNAFVEFVAEEQLMQVSRAASERLKLLTKQRYALEVDSGGGFVIRDDVNGGIRRPVSTLSGGETFLTSLALALALSAQIQLRGMYPLQFFFLDEGFGTLDPELLDTVITALEKLHHDKLSVGVISHVPELRARLSRKLVVTPAEQAGRGSRIGLETL
ncbi:AAA family ATPase [Paenibacillus arenosi]|uniref:Nuclease SbcCD subunit C n=1 Tax=Paenibacillus arenosi TaxID=2774142 RepID=A0ABR9ARH2_9BACL|nr:AAA family ATPase [Paenibacillus arenosi]MBD8496704.1 AAA family ATPase [Paenibacillus arenosi]